MWDPGGSEECIHWPADGLPCRHGADTRFFTMYALARSYHPGGVHVVFADGHVKFMGDSIDLPLWRALATRAGGESIDGGDS